MLVAKRGNSLGVRPPRALVDDLGLKPGDDLQIVAATSTRVEVVKDARRERAVDRAVDRARSHGFGFYDSLVEWALAAGCDTLLTEDLQAGRRIAGLTIVNPFA